MVAKKERKETRPSFRTKGASAASISEGKRSKYRKEMCAVVKKIMSDGGSRRSACAVIGISSNTFYKYLEKHPEFKQAIEEGEEQSFKYWEDMGKDLAENGSSSVWSLVMANRFGWRARNEVTGSDGGPLKIEIVQFKE